MKKTTLIPAIIAALLCMGAVTLTACTGGADPSKGTESESVTDTAGDSATESVAESDRGDTDTETSADNETDPAESASSESEGEVSSETNAESVAQTDAADTAGSGAESETSADPETAGETETEDETEGETEAVTAPPRYDYMEAEVAENVTLDKTTYTDMKLTLPAELEITDQDVKDYIEYIRFDYRVAVNGDAHMTDQAMKLGDDAYIYYKGMVDGEEFEGGSNWDDATPYTLGLGSGTFIPGFEEGLVGVIPANATKENPAEVHVTFPEAYNPALAGKAAVFYVAVEYAVQYDLPAYDRNFVENTLKYEGEKDFYTDAGLLSEFEGFIRSYLEEEIAADVENAKVNALWTYLTEAAECRNLPQLELDCYYDSYISEVEYYYDYYKSYGGEEFLKEYPTIDDFAPEFVGAEEGKAWKDVLHDMAAQMVKKDMIMHAIAELEGIETVTEEEYKAEIAYWVEYYQGYMTEAEVIANFGEIFLRESAFSAKMQSWLLEHATFSYESATEAE